MGGTGRDAVAAGRGSAPRIGLSAAVVALIAANTGVVGYTIGRSLAGAASARPVEHSLVDVAPAYAAGQQRGRSNGLAAGRRAGYRTGFEAGVREGRRLALATFAPSGLGYQRLYRQALRAARAEVARQPPAPRRRGRGRSDRVGQRTRDAGTGEARS